MVLETNLQAAFTRIGTEMKALIPPPLDTFAPGWVASGYPVAQTVGVLETAGSVHAAACFGPETPTIGATAFEQSAANTADANVPTPNGWSGTNWQVVRGSDSATPPSFGNNIARLEVTAFADLIDPSFGTIPGMQDLAKSSIQRNQGLRFSNLTIGNRYYGVFFFMTYPNSLTRATILTPDDGDLTSDTFGVDGVGWILSNGIRRYGWTATATDIEFIKASYDTAGSYISAMAGIHLGTP